MCICCPSTNPAARRARVAVGGVVVEASDWGVLRDRWQAALSRHGWPLDKEVKWHGTRTGEVPPVVADAVFEALVGAPITCATSSR